MERRTAAALALSVSATVLASGAAFAANVGLLDRSPDPVGRLEVSNVSDLAPTSTLADGTTPQTIVIDVPVGTSGPDDTSDGDDRDGPSDRPTTAARETDDDVSTSSTLVDEPGATTPSTIDDHDEDEDHDDEDEDHEVDDDGHDDDD